ncbi:hypothetical protein P8605_16455 [Streptomyces sp. T-3]|nr:hypothetical protein [Streptomyces sp. T-3]
MSAARPHLAVRFLLSVYEALKALGQIWMCVPAEPPPVPMTPDPAPSELLKGGV